MKTPHPHFRYEKLYLLQLGLAAALAVLAFCFDTPEGVFQGLWDIANRGDVLITDYFETAGPGAAFLNSALLTAAAVWLLYVTRVPANGFSVVTVGLMTAFGFFGKNIFNIWPILAGTWLYAALKREPFGRYVSVGLMATALSPLVSFAVLETPDGLHLLAGVAMGVVIGFVLPSVSAYTFRIQNGMNLYNMGFACGLVAMILVPVLAAFGDTPEPVLHWASGYNGPLTLVIWGLCLALLAGAFRLDRRVPAAYWRLLKTSGRLPSDYLRAFGPAPVMMSAAVNGLLAWAYIICTGGDLNGATLGGILAVMAFSTWGKHARNIVPVMLGVLIGGLGSHTDLNNPSLQLAGLFCTTLAPFAGVFGWPAGLAAGFLHSSVVLRVGLPLEGVNLYNNGFSGGMIAIVLYPFIRAVFQWKRPDFQTAEYYDVFEEDTPVAPRERD